MSNNTDDKKVDLRRKIPLGDPKNPYHIPTGAVAAIQSGGVVYRIKATGGGLQILSVKAR